MQLVITEKPSVARAIAQVLHAGEQKDGYLEGNGYRVSWCIGHLVELASADTYREEWKKWSYETPAHYSGEMAVSGERADKEAVSGIKKAVP